jgi:hypothetical protein
VRRDCKPHRGTHLCLAGVTAVLLGAGATYIGVPGLIGLPLAVVVWTRARRDLGEMRAGLMDPAGRRSVATARNLGLASVILNTVGLLLWAVLGLAMLFVK